MGFLKNELPKWVTLGIWGLIQIIIFAAFFEQYRTDPAYEYLRRILGLAFPFARSATICLKLNCFLILLPVCRNLISFSRSVLCKCCPSSIKRILDKNISFHKIIAYAICFWTAMHTIAHCYNVQFYVAAKLPIPVDDNSVNAYKLSSLGAGSCPVSPDDQYWLNPVCGETVILEVFRLFPALSGVIATLSLMVIVLSATEFLRRSHFEIFWFTHHWFIIFFVFLIVHGFNGAIRSLDPSTLSTRNITYCDTIGFDKWNKDPKCPMPTFRSNIPSFWHWLIAPIVIYFIEFLIRVYRSFQKVAIMKVIRHPSKVIELQMKKDGFSMDAGQYIFVKCSSISRLEWHPFTLTSSPEEDYFSVHVRIVGDWTTALSKAFDSDSLELQPTIAVDGPFGTASEDWDQYEVDVLIGAGIGVTPFASIMKHMWYSYINNRDNSRLKKVYFFWICPDTTAFEWFTDLLQHLEHETMMKGCADFLSYNIYLTRGWDANFARNVALQEEEARDAITGLQQKTCYGRPNWEQIFTKLSQDHPDINIGVFFCGPKILSTTLHKMCNAHSSGKTHFVYNKENF